MKYGIRGDFGGARSRFEKKPRLVKDLDDALHSLNKPQGYKVSASLPADIQDAFHSTHAREFRNVPQANWPRDRWLKEVPSELKNRSALPNTANKEVDLRHLGLRVDIEIERGNVGSIYRDIFKFNIHAKCGLIDLGIIIAPNRELSLALGENIAWSGRCEDELRISWEAKANADCPILLVELIPEHHENGAVLLDAAAAKRLRELQQSRGSREPYPQWRS